MPLSLIKRSTNGAPLSAAQNDANATAIESAVNTNADDLADLDDVKIDTADFQNAFTSFNGAKGQVAWDNIIFKPDAIATGNMFKALKTDAVQTVSATGGFVVNFPTESYDIGTVFNSTTGVFTPGFNGVYHIGGSVQVSLQSGSPTDVSITVSLRVNGVSIEQATFDNTGTGTRIYKLATMYKLTSGQSVDIYADFDFAGTATWQVDSNNTNFWGDFRYQVN